MPPSNQESVEVTMTRIETKLDAVLATKADHENRIRSLERKVWIASGVAAAATGVLTKLSPILGA